MVFLVLSEQIIGEIKIVPFDFPKEKSELIAQTAASLVDVTALYNEEVKDLDEEVRKEVFGL